VTVTETLLRKRKPNAYGIALAPATPVYYGFHYTDSGFGATLYAADGSWVSDRGEISTGDTLDSRATCILEDAGAKVGVGALVWPSDMQTLNVWDVEADATYTHVPDDGYLLDGACYHDGHLWWIEREPEQHGGPTFKTWFRLLRARCDLTNVTQIGASYELEHWAAGLLDSLLWPGGGSIQNRTAVFATAGAMNLYLEGEDKINHETSSYLHLRMPFSGSAPQTAAMAFGSIPEFLPDGAGHRLVSGKALLLASNALVTHDDAASLTCAAGWPAGAPWPDGWIFHVAYSPATQEATALTSGTLVRHAYPSAAANPDVQVTVAGHAEWSVPRLIFPME
jgi:hypothetical protein